MKEKYSYKQETAIYIWVDRKEKALLYAVDRKEKSLLYAVDRKEKALLHAVDRKEKTLLYAVDRKEQHLYEYMQKTGMKQQKTGSKKNSLLCRRQEDRKETALLFAILWDKKRE